LAKNHNTKDPTPHYHENGKYKTQQTVKPSYCSTVCYDTY